MKKPTANYQSDFAPLRGAMPDRGPGGGTVSCEVEGLIPRSLLRQRESRACSGVHTSDLSNADRPGAMLLLTVMITGAVALTISLHLALRGMHELDMGLATSKSLESLALAEGCREEALLQLLRDPHYRGGALTLGTGTCTIAVTEQSTERTIEIAAQIDRWTRHLTARVALSGPRLRLLEWREVSAE